MPLDQAVLDWQVIGHTTDENGDRKVDVVAVAARRDMIAQVLKAVSVAGLRPIGIDHSAFGMIRALAREVGAPVGPGEFVSAPPYEERAAAITQGVQGPVQTRTSRRPSSTATWATSPTLPSLAGVRACSPASPPSAWRASPRSSPSGAA